MRQREDWWEYTKRIIRSYPALERKRKAEDTLTEKEQRRYDAVRAAIEGTERMPTGMQRLALVDLVYWKRSHTLFGAAMRIPISERTAQKWNAQFIRMTEKYLDLPYSVRFGYLKIKYHHAVRCDTRLPPAPRG